MAERLLASTVGVESARPPTSLTARTRSLLRRAAAAIRQRPALRVLLFTALLATVSAIIYVLVLAGRTYAVPTGVRLPWPLIALGFLIAELKVVDVHFRREKHSFSLSEFPAVIGLFTLTPAEYLLALATGTFLALVYSRQSPLKLVFNIVNFMTVAILMLTVFHLGTQLAQGERMIIWAVAFAATSAAAVLSALTIATAISLSGGAPQYQKLPEMVQFGGLVAIANTSLALLAVAIIEHDMTLIVLLAVPLVTVFLAYRAYLSEREKHEQLELLFQSSRILQHSPELESAILALLNHARDMFRAHRAELYLRPRDDADEALLTSVTSDGDSTSMVPVRLDPADPITARLAREPHAFFHVPTPAERALSGIRQAMVAPLRGESGLIGSIVIANRITEGTAYLEEDLRLLETLANQAAVALENGQLEQSLAELSRLKEELRFQAYHDPLTGLANRSLLTERVEALLQARVPGAVPVVLFLDLDNFKLVNDSLGHAAGDRLLIAVADRVHECVRDGDLVARLGGDEFAVLLTDSTGLSQAIAITQRILDSLRASFHVEDQEISISASIGIAAAQAHTQRPDELLRNADVAMYTAKGDGKSRFAVFDPTVHAAIVARHALSSELGKAVGRGELRVLYQPIIALGSLSIVGVEALVRWWHPTRGLVGPDEFIGLAEESGTILSLGRVVLEEACREIARLDRAVADHAPLLLTVNLAAAQLKQPDFVPELDQIIRDAGLSANRLALEMTETAMFSDTRTTLARLEALRELGVQMAVDDFGTGYSSLSYLRRFQVDIIKIARDFVAHSYASDEWAFASAILALGRSLGLRIIAEGIEQTSQLRRLRELGCELGQGFLFAEPTDGAAIEQMLHQDVALIRRPASGALGAMRAAARLGALS